MSCSEETIRTFPQLFGHGTLSCRIRYYYPLGLVSVTRYPVFQMIAPDLYLWSCFVPYPYVPCPCPILLHPTLFLTVTRLKSASHPWRRLGGHCFKYLFHRAFVRATGAEPDPLEIKNENFAVRQTWIWLLGSPFVNSMAFVKALVILTHISKCEGSETCAKALSTDWSLEVLISISTGPGHHPGTDAWSWLKVAERSIWNLFSQ